MGWWKGEQRVSQHLTSRSQMQHCQGSASQCKPAVSGTNLNRVEAECRALPCLWWLDSMLQGRSSFEIQEATKCDKAFDSM